MGLGTKEVAQWVSGLAGQRDIVKNTERGHRRACARLWHGESVFSE